MKVKGIMGGSFLRELPRLRNCRRRKLSSWDRTGGNDDFFSIKKDEKAIIGDIKEIGCVTHSFMTIAFI